MKISYEIDNDPKAFLKNPILQPYTSKQDKISEIVWCDKWNIYVNGRSSFQSL